MGRGGGGASLSEAERLLPRGGSHAGESRRGSGGTSGRQSGSQSGGRATATPVAAEPRRGAPGRGQAAAGLY